MRIALCLAVVAALFGTTACGGGGTPTTPAEKPAANTPVTGGNLVIGYEQEPAILNMFIEGGDMMSTKDVLSNVLYGLLRAKPDFTYEPLIAEEVPSVANGLVKTSPKFEVTYKIRKEAVWSDGTPITSGDVKFTWETIMNSKWKIITKTGYDQIEKIDTPDDKTAVITFKKVYAPFKDLFSLSQCLLPKHALEGKDFNTVWNKEVTVASGPFTFKEWKAGDSITLVRNDKFWGAHKAYLDQVVWKFIPDTNTEMAQFKTGEVDAINPAPDVNLIDQIKASGTAQADPGTIWEHLAFNLDKDPVKDINVRKAVAYAVDRGAITAQVMKGQVQPLQDIFVPQQASVYEPNWEQYAFDKTKAEDALKASGYTKGADGFYAKGGKRLTIEIRSTAGNKGREKLEQIMQQQLKDVGIELKINNIDADTFFSKVTPNGEFQLGEWAWVASPDPSVTTLFCSDQVPPGGQNYYRYKNDAATKAFHDSDNEADDAKRAALLKEGAKQMAADVPIIPLYQRLQILGFRNNVHGAKNNPTLEGAFWNIGEWWKDAAK